MKILFVAQNFQMGGIQKALVNTIHELHKEDKFDIDVFTFGDGLLLKDLPQNVSVYKGSLLLRLVSTPFSMVKRGNILYLLLRIASMIIVRIAGAENFYRYLFSRQKKLAKYDTAVSYFNDVQGAYFNRGTNQFVEECISADAKIAWIHTDPFKAGIKHDTALKTYRNFDKIVCVSDACRQKFIELLPEFKSNTSVVYNVFPVERIKEEAMRTRIVSVGRIDNATKRFDMIPRICKMLREDRITDFEWKIIGDGPDLKKIKKLADVYGVADLVKFTGGKTNAYKYIKESDMLVITSVFEGYPMVAGEALVLGVPVITTCYAAANEQIRNNYNGIITETELEDIYIVIRYLLQNPHEITRLKNNINDDIFSNMNAIQQFEKVIGYNHENH